MENEADFLKNEKPNEYEASFTVTGKISVEIKADSREDAERQARAMLDDEEFGYDIDDVTDVDFDWVNKTRPMFLVRRNGVNMQVSHIEETDIPRQPDERGF